MKAELGCPVLTDVTAPSTAPPWRGLRHPSSPRPFLLPPDDLLLAAGETGAAVNVKKGRSSRPGT